MPGAQVKLLCKDCKYWYGAEDEGAGPCSLKHGRGDAKFLTWGNHACDEKAALKEYATLRKGEEE